MTIFKAGCGKFGDSAGVCRDSAFVALKPAVHDIHLMQHP